MFKVQRLLDVETDKNFKSDDWVQLLYSGTIYKAKVCVLDLQW